MASPAKSVLVTGANSSIGLVTALELAGAGYDVVGSVRSADKADKAEKVHAIAKERGVELRTVLLDVDDDASCRSGPLARYVVGADAVSGILADTFAPTVISDYVKALGSGLRRLPVRVPFLG